MRVQIETAAYNSDGSMTVTFRCQAGSALAKWQGRSVRSGQVRSAELEIDDPLIWASNVTPMNEPPLAPSLTRTDSNEVVLIAKMTHAWSDGTVALDLGDGAVALRIDGIPESVDRWVQIRARSITLYDASL